MCRYALTTYKQHFACFRCRKAFKRRLKLDVDPTGPEQPARCPECGQMAAEMGLDFQPPPRADKKQWTVLESLWSIGETFHSCGCGGPGYRPRSPVAYREFLASRLREYETTLARWERDVGHAGRTQALETWRRRIEAVRNGMATAATDA